MKRLGAALLAAAVVLASVPVVAVAAPTVIDDPGLVVQKDAGPTPLDVLANDTIAAGATLAVATPAEHGAIFVDGLTLTYAPDVGYAGPDSFEYTVAEPDDSRATATATVFVNAPPVAVDDPAIPACNPSFMFGGSFPLPEDHEAMPFALGCEATSNDSDPDGEIVAWQIDDLPDHGEVEWLPTQPGFFEYRPDADYSTAAAAESGGAWTLDSLSYHVIDDRGQPSNTATYRFWVAPVNDPPVVLATPTVTVDEDSGPYGVSWLDNISAGPANESDQHIDVVITAGESHGVVNLFSVPPTFTGEGDLTFTPGPNEHGFADLTFHLRDDGGLENYGVATGMPQPDDTSDDATLTIVVLPVNDAPSTARDALTVAEDQGTASPVDVLENDTDVEGDALHVSAKTNGAKGVVSITGGGSGVSYKPHANAFGTDSFTYSVSDGNGGTTTETVEVTITAANDAPNAVNDGVPTPYRVYLKAGPTAIPVLGNDSSAPDGPETLTITGVGQGSHGTVATTGGGTGLTYAAAGTTTGIDVFTYTVSDGHGGADTASVQVMVAADTTAPTATITKLWTIRLRGRPTARVTITWSFLETQSGVASQVLQRRTDGGAWTSMTLASSALRAATVNVPIGHRYEFRVRATDRSGNVGAFAVSRLVAT